MNAPKLESSVSPNPKRFCDLRTEESDYAQFLTLAGKADPEIGGASHIPFRKKGNAVGFSLANSQASLRKSWTDLDRPIHPTGSGCNNVMYPVGGTIVCQYRPARVAASQAHITHRAETDENRVSVDLALAFL